MLFMEEKTSKNCHMGHLDNIDTDFLTASSDSQDPQGIYLNLNKIGDLENYKKPWKLNDWVFLFFQMKYVKLLWNMNYQAVLG